MKLSHLTTSLLAITLITGCSQAEQATNVVKNTASTATQKSADIVKTAATDTVQKGTNVAKKITRSGVSISNAVPGVYKSEATHAYITFQYLHQGYARPTLRWNNFDATVNLDPSNSTASTLNVTIDASSIDSGVEKFDEHLVSADFFDVANHPTITFDSTSLIQASTGRGTVVGDLTMKGVTKPVELFVTLNKVGENFRSKKPMIGISAKTKIKRSEWDLGKYTPLVGDDVDINIEVEFIKED